MSEKYSKIINSPEGAARRKLLEKFINNAGLTPNAFENKYNLGRGSVRRIITKQLQITYRMAYLLSKITKIDMEVLLEEND